MVLASNEWLNNCEDDQKSANTANTNTAAAAATTTTTVESTAAAAATDNTTATTFNNISTTTILDNTNIEPTATTSAAGAATTTTSTSSINSSYNNEQIEHETKQQQLQLEQRDKYNQQQQQVSMLNTQNLEIMADDLNETPLKIETVNVNANVTKLDEIENNNQDNLSLNDSNTNTLQGTSITHLNNNKSIPASSSILPTDESESEIPLSNPITAQALSTALQSVMNAANTTGSNVQNNFLSSLGIDINATNVSLQQTAKQLNSSLCALETQVNLANCSGNNLDGSTDMAGVGMAPHDNNGQAKIVLLCESESHPFQTRSILLMPNIECKVGRLIAKSKAAESNAIFDCKVLSRNHAVLWYTDDGKFWVKDTKSSNGTFINENKLGTDAAELHFGDIVKFGVTVLENSRKEVHGCIIACVKLYLPDGRESISIDSNATQRSQYSGEGRIRFDELYRLNLFMQEASQREKVLKSKLFNIQNILDATRKNSALCWQSMIAEDQLLHRIHSLEKKIQIMEKNVPESVLRNEVLKLLDDKNSYQHTAKEALRKVYQERCDAMQMLSKMESAYTASDSECKILRDQIMNTKQSLQDVNARLLRLETEYNEYKEDADRQQQEAKEQDEQRTTELLRKLRERELEIEEMRTKISNLLLKRAELLFDDDEQLQQQAIEKLDAAIADMDLGDDDEDDEEEEDNDENDNENNIGDAGNAANVTQEQTKQQQQQQQNVPKEAMKNATENEALSIINGGVVASSAGSNKKKKTKAGKSAQAMLDKEAKYKVVKESTIMKWLQNSDLNQKEGSLDIFKAICNESDSSDEQETANISKTETGAGAKTTSTTTTTATTAAATKFNNSCEDFELKLQNVQTNLKQLEAEIANETSKTANVIEKLDDGSAFMLDDSDEEADDACVAQRNGKLDAILSKNNKNYLLLKKSVNMLREAYNEICDNVQQQQQQSPEQLQHERAASPNANNKPQSAITPAAITMHTQSQNYAPHALKKLQTQDTLKSDVKEENDSDEDYDEDDDISDATTTRQSCTSSRANTIKGNSNIELDKAQREQLEQEIKAYQQEITGLNDKLEQIESDSLNTLEIMQIECDAFKDKVAELTKLTEVLRSEKATLESTISERTQTHSTTVVSSSMVGQACIEDNNANNTTVTLNVATTSARSIIPNNVFEQQIQEELTTINSNIVQREEELIVYKEQLEQTQNDNLRLRNEICDLKLKADDYNITLMKRMLPYGAAVVAIIVYFLTTYF